MALDTSSLQKAHGMDEFIPTGRLARWVTSPLLHGDPRRLIPLIGAARRRSPSTRDQRRLRPRTGRPWTGRPRIRPRAGTHTGASGRRIVPSSHGRSLGVPVDLDGRVVIGTAPSAIRVGSLPGSWNSRKLRQIMLWNLCQRLTFPSASQTLQPRGGHKEQGRAGLSTMLRGIHEVRP